MISLLPASVSAATVAAELEKLNIKAAAKATKMTTATCQNSRFIKLVIGVYNCDFMVIIITYCFII